MGHVYLKGHFSKLNFRRRHVPPVAQDLGGGVTGPRRGSLRGLCPLKIRRGVFWGAAPPFHWARLGLSGMINFIYVFLIIPYMGPKCQFYVSVTKGVKLKDGELYGTSIEAEFRYASFWLLSFPRKNGFQTSGCFMIV